MEELELASGRAIDTQAVRLTVQPAGPERSRQVGEGADVDPAGRIPWIGETGPTSQLGCQKRFSFREIGRQVDEVLPQPRRLDLEFREDHMSDPVPQSPGVEIAGVLPPVDLLFPQPATDLLTAPRQERADQPVSCLSRDPGHGPGACAAQQLDKDAFGNIVPVVGGGHDRDLSARRVFVQRTVAPAPPGRLTGGGALMVVGQRDELEWDLEGAAEEATELGIRIRLGAPQAVVNVGRREPKIEGRIAQKVEEGDRVPSARQSHEQRLPDEVGECALEVLDKLCGVHLLHASSDRHQRQERPA